MDSSIQAAAWSLETLGQRYRAIAHNLANASTVGFKRQVRSAVAAEGADAPDGQIVGRASIDFTQGAAVQTHRPLDLALQGDGLFVLETPDGPLYTRDGVFHVNAEGQLVDTGGRLLGGEGGPIVLPPGVSAAAVQISAAGEVSAAGQRLGTIRVVAFDDPGRLEPVGDACFRAPPDLQPKDAEDASVHQGYQEASNVRVVEELVDLIMVTRLYEANLRSIQGHDDQKKDLLRVAMGA
jgi:flagellar basal body rod protein FlgG